MNDLKILDIFNEYIERGGESFSVEYISTLLSSTYAHKSLRFDSKDWVGAMAPSKLRQVFLMARNPHSIEQLQDILSSFRPNVVIFHNVMPVGSMALYDEVLREGIPIIQYIHNFRPFSVNGYLWGNGQLMPQGLQKNFWPEIFAGAWQGSRVKTAWYAALLWDSHRRGVWKKVSAWIAISQFMKDQFVKAGITEEKIFVVPHAWTIKSDPSPDAGDGFLFLGRLTVEKGVLVLLEAWHQLHAELGSNCPRLTIAGEGPLSDQVSQASKDNDRIHFAGFLSGEEKTQALASCRALIIPSIWWEPLGLVAYEAYEHGKPVLAADSGGLSEVVFDGETGIKHPPGNISALVKDTEKLHRDEDLAEKMGLAGRAWLEAHGTEGQWINKINHALSYAKSTP